MLRPNERYDAGKSDEEAAIDIAMNRFRDWGEPERLVVNVDPTIANLRGRGRLPGPMRLFDPLVNA